MAGVHTFESVVATGRHFRVLHGYNTFDSSIVAPHARASYLFIPSKCFLSNEGTLDGFTDAPQSYYYKTALQLFTKLYSLLPDGTVTLKVNGVRRTMPERLFYMKYMFGVPPEYQRLDDFKWACYYFDELLVERGGELLKENPKLQENKQAWAEAIKDLPHLTDEQKDQLTSAEECIREATAHVENQRDELRRSIAVMLCDTQAQSFEDALAALAPDGKILFQKKKRLLVAINQCLHDHTPRNAEDDLFGVGDTGDSNEGKSGVDRRYVTPPAVAASFDNEFGPCIDLAEIERDNEDVVEELDNRDMFGNEQDSGQSRDFPIHPEDPNVAHKINEAMARQSNVYCPLLRKDWVGILFVCVAQSYTLDELEANGLKNMRDYYEKLATDSKSKTPIRCCSLGSALCMTLFEQKTNPSAYVPKRPRNDPAFTLSREEYVTLLTNLTDYQQSYSGPGALNSNLIGKDVSVNRDSIYEPCNSFTLSVACSEMAKHGIAFGQGCEMHYYPPLGNDGESVPGIYFPSDISALFRVRDDEVAEMVKARYFFHSTARPQAPPQVWAPIANPNKRPAGLLRLSVWKRNAIERVLDVTQAKINENFHSGTDTLVPVLKMIKQDNLRTITEFYSLSLLQNSPNRSYYIRCHALQRLRTFMSVIASGSQHSLADDAVYKWIKDRVLVYGTLSMPMAKVTRDLSGFADMMIQKSNYLSVMGSRLPAVCLLLMACTNSVTLDGAGVHVLLYGPRATGKSHSAELVTEIQIPETVSNELCRMTKTGTAGTTESHHMTVVLDEAVRLLVGNTDSKYYGAVSDNSQESLANSILKQVMASKDGEIKVKQVANTDGKRQETRYVSLMKQVFWFLFNILPDGALSESMNSRLVSVLVGTDSEDEVPISLSRAVIPGRNPYITAAIDRFRRDQALAHWVGQLVDCRVLTLDDTAASQNTATITKYLKSVGLYHGDIRKVASFLNVARVLCVWDAIRIVFDSEASPALTVDQQAGFSEKTLMLLQPYLCVSREHLIFAMGMCWQTFQNRARQLVVEALIERYYPGDLSQYINAFRDKFGSSYYAVNLKNISGSDHKQPSSSSSSSATRVTADIDTNSRYAAESRLRNILESKIASSSSSSSSAALPSMDDEFLDNVPDSALIGTKGTAWVTNNYGQLLHMIRNSIYPLITSENPGPDIIYSVLKNLNKESASCVAIDNTSVERMSTTALYFEGDTMFLSVKVVESVRVTVESAVKECFAMNDPEPQTVLIGQTEPGSPYVWKSVTIPAHYVGKALSFTREERLKMSSVVQSYLPNLHNPRMLNPSFRPPGIIRALEWQQAVSKEFAKGDAVASVDANENESKNDLEDMTIPFRSVDHLFWSRACDRFLRDVGIEADYMSRMELPPIKTVYRDRAIVAAYAGKSHLLPSYRELTSQRKAVFDQAAVTRILQPSQSQQELLPEDHVNVRCLPRLPSITPRMSRLLTPNSDILREPRLRRISSSTSSSSSARTAADDEVLIPPPSSSPILSRSMSASSFAFLSSSTSSSSSSSSSFTRMQRPVSNTAADAFYRERQQAMMDQKYETENTADDYGDDSTPMEIDHLSVDDPAESHGASQSSQSTQDPIFKNF